MDHKQRGGHNYGGLNQSIGRLEKLIKKLETLESSDDSSTFFDYILYSCIMCFHVRDAILFETPGINSVLNTYIEDNLDLKRMQCLANGIKHCKIDSDHNIDKFPNIEFPSQGETHFSVIEGKKCHTISLLKSCCCLRKQFIDEHDIGLKYAEGGPG